MTQVMIPEENTSAEKVFTPDHVLESRLAEIESRIEQLAELDELKESDNVDIPDPTWVWRVPFSTLTLEQTLYLADMRIRSRNPGYFITANLNWVMLTDQNPKLHAVNRDAAFILADGMPIVWWAKLQKGPCIPERVAGSELIFTLSKWSADRGHRVFFLGGEPGIANTAAKELQVRYPSLNIVGTECPPFRELSNEENQAMLDRIRAANPDILYVAFGQPKGELWIHENYKKLGIPMCVQVGASFNFVAGNVRRAPVFMQKIGLEWLFRFWEEPRLGPRYFRNAKFLAKAVLRDWFSRKRKPAAEDFES